MTDFVPFANTPASHNEHDNLPDTAAPICQDSQIPTKHVARHYGTKAVLRERTSYRSRCTRTGSETTSRPDHRVLAVQKTATERSVCKLLTACKESAVGADGGTNA